MNGRRWMTGDSETLRSMNAAGYDDTQIAKATGHCVKTIRRKRHEMQLSSYYTVRYGNWGDMTADARRAISELARLPVERRIHA